MKRLVILVGLVIGIACSSQRRLNAPPRSSWDVATGQIENEWETGHPKRTERGPCSKWQATTEITEIGLERTPCLGHCPVYTILIAADGSVDYFGQANVPRVGHHHGKLKAWRFRDLALLALDLGLLEMPDEYDCDATDLPTAYVSVTRGGAKKIIRHSAPSGNGPPRLWMFEQTVDAYAADIEWTE